MSNGGIKTRAHRGRIDDINNNEGRETALEFVTGQPIGPSKIGMDTVTLGSYYITQSANPEAASTARTINATGHAARRGDIIRILTSANGIQEREIAVDSITANTIVLVGDATDSAGAAAAFDPADTYDILRPTTLRTGADGGLATGPVSFLFDSVITTVEEDTVTPANNRPLPVKLTDITGDINITANDLNVQLSHSAASPDSVQIGDGTEIMLINASGEAQVIDSAARTSLASIDAKMVDGTDIGDVTINNGAAGAAVNIQDGGNSITVDDGGGALTVDAVDLDIRDLAHTQDSVRIGDGVELVNVNASNEMQVADDTARTSLAAINAKFGSLGQKASAGSAPVVLSTDQEVILTAIQTAVEIIDNIVAGSEAQVDIVDAGPVATEVTLAAQSAKLPASLGPKASAASFSVTFANDEPDIGIGADNVVAFTRLDFSSSNVTGAAYTELIADIGGTAGKKVQIFMASGDPMYLATGAAASETDRMIIPPGGLEGGFVEVSLAVNARLSLKRVLAGTTSAGNIIINVMG